MKYRDLIQFEPVTEVIQLRLADEKEQAKRLVSTFVISDRMADVILHRILPALSIDPGQTGRGLFIVGNYGTGKSHLMSVVSAVAEHADLVASVHHQAVINGLQSIAGKFKVVRQETSSTEMHLRDLVLRDLENQLAGMGVDFHFPAMDQTISNKQLLVDMMRVFNQIYPGQGLLVALDELLDFLRMRKDQQLIMDLNFLREIGEACEIVPLRFITGVQEALFDNPRFQFAADSIRRVRSRFDQVAIVREDLAYVVSHRLLVKTEAQRRLIRSHLEKFTRLYAAMAERLDQYIELFPVHPAYLEIFEQVTIGERRDLLKALSTQMTAVLDLDVPPDQPGLIAFNSYWRALCEDAAYRTIPEVRIVQDKANVLAERIRQSPPMKEYRAPALRIIDALALHRLTTGDLYAPLGITPTEIRDRLCLHIPIPEEDADFLLATIKSVLTEIMRTVSGQFITHNSENDQYYLDLKKDIDYDALIDQRALSLEAAAMDRYFFDVLARALELTDSSYVPGFRIWQREIPWSGHGITRQGYIFLGAPNERSTAHPERDFYLHFLALYGNGRDSIQNRPDEVFFLINSPDAAFESQIRRFAGAREMSAISSGSNKDQYDRKAEQARSQLTIWLRENLLRAFQIRYAEETLSIPEVVARHRISMRDLPFRDQVFRLAGAILAGHFDAKFPLYPRFEGVEFTSETARSAAEGALRALAGGPVTRMSQAALEGLGLVRFENGRPQWTVEDSPYARHFLELLTSLEKDRVINRSELVQGESGAERDIKFKLEPEWVLLILLALVRQGTLTLNLPGLHIAEGELDGTLHLSLDQLWRFTSISRPKELPELALRELFTGLGLNPDVLDDPRSLEGATTQLQQQVISELEHTVRTLNKLSEGLRFWREPVLPPAEQAEIRTTLENYRQFLNSMQNLSTPSRLRNLSQGAGEIRAAFKARQTIFELVELVEILQVVQPAQEYPVTGAEPAALRPSLANGSRHLANPNLICIKRSYPTTDGRPGRQPQRPIRKSAKCIH